MNEAIVCASCNNILTLPTTVEQAKSWQRHSKHVHGKLKFIYTCGSCDSRKVVARFNRR